MRNAAKKILIIDSYAGNIGDVGILVSLVDQLERKYPSSRITIESSHPRMLTTITGYKKNRIIPRVFDIENIDSETQGILDKFFICLVGIYDMISVVTSAILKRSGINTAIGLRSTKSDYLRVFSESDLIISTGGGFLSTNYQYLLRLYVYFLGYILRKKIIHIAQSIGPFNSQMSKILIPFFLNSSPLISLREPYSYKYLRQFMLNRKPIITADLAFILKSGTNLSSLTVNSKNKNIVAISIKEDKNKSVENKFLNAIEEVSRHLIKKRFYLIYICHTYKDWLMAKNLSERVNSPLNVQIIPFGIHPKLLKYLYGKCSFVIASRMHSIVFCSDLGVPFISISSDNKFLGLHMQLKYDSKLFIKYSNVDGNRLKKATNHLLKRSSKLRRELRGIIFKIREASKRNMTLINAQLRNI